MISMEQKRKQRRDYDVISHNNVFNLSSPNKKYPLYRELDNSLQETEKMLDQSPLKNSPFRPKSFSIDQSNSSEIYFPEIKLPKINHQKIQDFLPTI